MSAIVPTITRASRQGSLRLTAAAASTLQRRSTSWIAWEQPDPAVYARPPSSETQQAAVASQTTRSVGETVTAPATAAVAGGSQEVSTSGKTAAPSIPANRTPFGQTRSLQTQVEVVEALPTTLLRIPGEIATWPGEPTAYPDQERVRKQQGLEAFADWVQNPAPREGWSEKERKD
ncbi:hypothetical protein F4677DRAFT_460150 [Hypoxylon crocopeplum]|nr:hypothetical protein F4677DRAFT_460150 [Hypoxylon crocopeplum]